jgi:ADP-dependent NAD(P)H-hydrate dehydratase
MESPLPTLPPRPTDGHKGTFGTVCVVGGQAAAPRMMIGGPALSALAALRSGAGLAVLAMPAPILPHGLTIAPSATGLALPVNPSGALLASETAEVLDRFHHSFACIAVGPGFGAELPQQQVVVRLIAQADVPLVVDADAINCLAALHDFRGDFRASAILTPHVGEFRRLAAGLGLDRTVDSAEERQQAAVEIALRLGCVVVLKCDRTVVTDGISTWTSPAGNVALATAGTGDVLTGVIASLVGQFFRPHMGGGSRQVSPAQQGGLSLFECACLGVFAHGKAADEWAARHGPAGMLAADLLEALPASVNALR